MTVSNRTVRTGSPRRPTALAKPPKTARTTPKSPRGGASGATAVETASADLAAGSTRNVRPADWAPASNRTTRAAYFSNSDVLKAGGDGPFLQSFLKDLEGTGINAVIVDIKEGDGVLTFRTKAQAGPEGDLIRSNTSANAADLSGIVAAMHKKGLKVVVRQVLFKDGNIIKRAPQTAIQDSKTGGPWGSTKEWVNPYNPLAQQYNIAVAKQALAAGADEIQFDYIRFPDAGTGNKANASFPGAQGEHADAIVSFLKKASGEIKRDFPKAKIGADVFGIVANGTNRNDWLGQNVGRMAQYLDVIWPMQYPSHWAHAGSKPFGTEHPETKPAEVYDSTTRALIRQIGPYASKVSICPYVAAFSEVGKTRGGVQMLEPKAGEIGPYVTRQIKGIQSGDGNGFAIWSSTGAKGGGQKQVFDELRKQAKTGE